MPYLVPFVVGKMNGYPSWALVQVLSFGIDVQKKYYDPNVIGKMKRAHHGPTSNYPTSTCISTKRVVMH